MKVIKRIGGANAYGVTLRNQQNIAYKLGFNPTNTNSNAAKLRKLRFQAAKKGIDPNTVSLNNPNGTRTTSNRRNRKTRKSKKY